MIEHAWSELVWRGLLIRGPELGVGVVRDNVMVAKVFGAGVKEAGVSG